MAVSVSDVERILKDDAFKKLSRENVDQILSLAQNLEGKSSAESMRLILGFSQTIKNCNFSKEEQAAMQQAVLQSLSKEDAQKFSALMRFMQFQ